MTRPRLLLLAASYALLVAHLLFVPYAYAPLAFEAALARFTGMQWLPLGSDQNIAFVARAMMFLPLGALLAAGIAPKPGRDVAWMALFFASLLGGGWALAVNFAQLWFPSRTVLLNLVAAQFVGVIGGAFGWAALGHHLREWWRRLISGGLITLNAALGGYVFLYLLASLAPFDFVTGIDQLQEKAASNLYGLWRAPLHCGPVSCEVRLLVEFAMTVPCGWWYAVHRRGGPGTVPAALVISVLVALSIEALHFLMVSGVSQGSSVLARTLGMAAGAYSYRWRGIAGTIDVDRVGRPLVLLLAAPHGALVAYVAGWFRTPLVGWTTAAEQAREIVWLPFFYLYFTPYTATMQSLIVHALIYLPVGAAAWLWSRRRAEVALGWAAGWAVALSVVAETSKVFLLGRHPDYGDVVLAAMSAVFALAVLRWMARPHGASPAPARPQDQPPATRSSTPAASASAVPIGAAAGAAAAPKATFASHRVPAALRRVASVALLAIIVWSLTEFPVGKSILAVAIALYAALLWRWPHAYLLVLPSALPLLDLAPYSGRFFWDEFDVLLATTLAVRLMQRLPARQQANGVSVSRIVALSLLALSVIVSTSIAIFPLAPLDANAFSNYLSNYNALRVAKGYAWAGVLLWLITRDAAVFAEVPRRLLLGLGLGLCAAVAGVLWERALFVGVTDLQSWFRASGLVSATHVGGAYLEALLVTLAPFGLAMAVGATRVVWRAAWFAIVALSAGAVLMTLSRAAFAAWAVAIVVFGVAYWVRTRGRGKQRSVSWRWITVAACSILIVTGGLLARSTSLGDRLKMTGADFAVRVAHWRNSLQLMREDPLRAAFGTGLGSFPREFYLAQGSSLQLPAYQLGREGKPPVHFLSLNGGHGMYLDQRVGVNPGTRITVHGRLRSPQGNAKVSIALCEKSLLASMQCDWAEVAAVGAWQPFEVTLDVPELPGSRSGLGLPVSLSLSNREFGKRVDVTDLSLIGDGTERLRNGSFEGGLDHWFMVSDLHLAWRTLNMPVQIMVEQGVLGVLAWFLLMVAAIVAGLRSIQEAAMFAAVCASAIGLLIVCAFDSPLDSPRLIVLAALMAAAAIGMPVRTASLETR